MLVVEVLDCGVTDEVQSDGDAVLEATAVAVRVVVVELEFRVGDLEAALHEQGALEDYDDGAPDDEEDDDDEVTESVGRDGGSDPGGGDDADTGGGQAGLDAFEGGNGNDSESGGEPAPREGGDDGAEGGEAADDGVVAEAAPTEAGVEIVIDQRELDASIARNLSRRDGIVTRLETLQVGDYVVSDRVVVERKTVSDFLDTLVGGDRSLFEQVGDDARHYARPVVVIEGEDLYGERNVHPKSINGALASLAVDFGASVLRTADEGETADLLASIARREQDESDREVSIHGEKQSRTLDEQQVYTVASIAEVGPVIARALLKHFGSVEAVMTAEEDELREAEGVGEVTAERIREVVSSEYDPT